MKNKRKILFHIDVDSPLRLLEFYQVNGVKFDQADLEDFYETAFGRIFEFIAKLDIKASFFVVGKEIEGSERIHNIIRKAHSLGHEIENHTYSHPFGLAEMEVEEIKREITKCSELIHSITGRRPVGFRAPGYSINNKVLEILKDEGFKYDSSCFWSVMIPALKYGKKILLKGNIKSDGFGYVGHRLPHEPYEIMPDLAELPLPRLKFSGLPFYNNFNLWAPAFYSSIVSKTIRRKTLVYLFHAVEFVDMSDNLPKEISNHPNIKMPLKVKLARSEKIVRELLERYEPMLSGGFIR
jgi:peptidoglycan/xylan/chitin deacetylase (PgdA/CDA1 family)